MSAGERGRRRRISVAKLERLSDLLALGPTLAARLALPHDLPGLARDVGLPQLQVDRIKNHPEFAERVLKKIRVRAIYLAAEALDTIGEKAKVDERAFSQLMKVASGESGGVTINNNNVNAQVTHTTVNTVDAVRGDRKLLEEGKRLFGRLGLVVMDRAVPADATIEGGSTSAAS